MSKLVTTMGQFNLRAVVLAAAVAASAGIVRADDVTALKDRLHEAERTSTLNNDDLQSYHLKMTVQLFDKKGKPSEQGTVEAFWAGVGKEKLVYSFPSYSATEVHANGKLFRTDGASDPPQDIRTVLREVQQPMPTESEIDASQPQIDKVNFGKVPLECIMLARPIEGMAKIPTGLFPTYCFDAGKSILRADYNFGTQLVVRNRIGTFQQRNLATEIAISENNVQAAKGEVVVLQTQQVTDADLATDGLRVIDANTPVKVAGGVVAGFDIEPSRSGLPRECQK